MANTLVIANYSRGLSSGVVVRFRYTRKYRPKKYRSKESRLCVAAGVALCLVLRVDSAPGQDHEQEQRQDFSLTNFFKRPDQRAAELLEDGQYERAASEFNNPQWRGVSKFRDGKYQEAMEDFAIAEDATGLYNHGTAAVRAGDYTQAVSSFEKALTLAPDDANISHNLEIAKKLRDLADQQQQEQQDNQQGGEQSESQDSENGDEQSESEDSQNGEEGSGESSESQTDDSQANESEAGDSHSDGTESQNDGEMNAEQGDQTEQQDAQALREMMQQEQQTDDAEQQEQQSEAVAGGSAPSPLSEDDQATEQWLRRIPDDGSQLLRNKIRLNHLIEYPDVQDMQEPW